MSEGTSPAAPISAAVAASALAWLADAGLDVAVSATPRIWLAEAKPVEMPIVETHAPRPTQTVHAPVAAPVLDQITSLDALDTALKALDHPLKTASLTSPQRLFEGPVESPLLVLAEMPLIDGSDEARLLAAMLAAVGMAEADVAHVNILPWPMQGRRPARPADLAYFTPYALRGLALMAPRLVLALGSRAASLADPDAPPATLRGRWLALAGAPMVASFAPSMLLGQPRLKAEAWADLQQLAQRISR